jgi:hypothetical protein
MRVCCHHRFVLMAESVVRVYRISIEEADTRESSKDGAA